MERHHFKDFLLCMCGSFDEVSCIKNIKDEVDFVEYRGDASKLLFKDVLGKFHKEKVKVLYTYRSKREGGFLDIDKESYKNKILEAIDLGADAVDVEYFSGINIKEISILARKKGCLLISSYHDFSGEVDEEKLTSLLSKMKNEGSDISKVAVFINNKNDLKKLKKISKKTFNINKIIVGMGKYGVDTRIYPEKYGSLVTFVPEKNAVAPGQISVKELKKMRKNP